MYPLLLVVGLIVYGSLYPWHFAAAHANPWLVLMGSWPSKWNNLALQDALVNTGGYVPLGILAFRAWARRNSLPAAAAAAVFTGLLLSLSMELLQVYVPARTSSLFDVACNLAGASAGALAAWHFSKPGSRFRQRAVPPVLLLSCWAGLHFYPFLPWINFARLRFEMYYMFHPGLVSPIAIWIFAAEWLAVGMVIQGLFGRVRLRWLLMALAFHFVARPIMVSLPFSLEEALGMALALLLWKTLPEPVRSGPWLLVSVVFLREFAPLQGIANPPAFSWVPFQVLLSSDRVGAIIMFFRQTFDYGAILWLGRSRGMTYGKSGMILAGALAVLAILQGYFPRDVLSMTDPAMALLIALVFRSCDS